MLTIAFVTGTEPGKWFARFRRRTTHGPLTTLDSHDPVALLTTGAADLALARLPDQRIDARFHVVSLYREARGVAVPRESLFAEAGETLRAADIAEEPLNYRIAEDAGLDYEALAAALQVVAANVGVAVAPRPVLKVMSRRQVVPLELDDDTVPQTSIALVWPREQDSDAIQDFVGIAKGRTENSSRQAAPRRSAREKALARQERRGQRDSAPGHRGGPARRGRGRR